MPRKLLNRAKALFDSGRSSANCAGLSTVQDNSSVTNNDDSASAAVVVATSAARPAGEQQGTVQVSSQSVITSENPIPCFIDFTLPLSASSENTPRMPTSSSAPVAAGQQLECSCDKLPSASTKSKFASFMTSCLSMRRSRSTNTKTTTCARHPSLEENTEESGNLVAGARATRSCSLTLSAGLNVAELRGLSENQRQLLMREVDMEEGIDMSAPQQDQLTPTEQAANNNARVRRISMHWFHDTGRMARFLEGIDELLQLPQSENGAPEPGPGPVLGAPQTVVKPVIHTQIDYIHCLVPDIHKICQCSFYWGVMDRYEAEEQLDNKPEGTFLLRDSAQEDFLFSVSFRRYGRSLHARIEQWNHRFSFDAHDPNVYSSRTVHGLIEHYKDPSCCMFFEPMLLHPLPRPSTFSLQHLCRATICDSTTYDNIDQLNLPNCLKEYLKFYHYKQKVRVRKMENGGYVHVNV